MPNTTETQPRARRSNGELEPKGFDRMTNGELERLVASDLGSVVERPRVISRAGFWVTLRGRERRAVGDVLLAVRPSDRLDVTTTERVMDAAAVCRAMDHPAVIAPRQIGRGSQLLWILYRPGRGELLSEAFGEGCVPSLAAGTAFMDQVVGPLHALHEAGLVHGALTPSSFYRSDDGTVRVLSPGVDARILRATLASGIGNEAIGYAAPEVRAERPPVAASDQYSVAAILVRILTGSFPGPLGEIPEGRIPPAWIAGLERALTADPTRRFDDVNELRGALSPLPAPGLESSPRAARSSSGSVPDETGRGSVYVPSAFRPRKGVRDRLERDAAASSPGEFDSVLLFPPEERWRQERWASYGRPVSRRRQAAGGLALLLLLVAAGLVYVRGPEAVSTWARTAVQAGRQLLGELESPIARPRAEFSPVAPTAEGGTAEIAEDERADETTAAVPPATDANDASAPEPIETEESGRAPVPPPSSAPPAARQPLAARPRSSDAPAPESRAPAIQRPPIARQPIAPLVESPPLPSGSISIQTYPWAVIYVDGHYAGTSPLIDVSLPAGTHLMRAERVGYEPYEQNVTVQPGESVRVTGIVLRGVGR